MAKSSKLLSVAKAGTSLVASTSIKISSIPTIKELISAVAVTSTLLQTLDSTLETYSGTVFCDAGFIGPLCEVILGVFEEANGVVEEFEAKIGNEKRVHVLGGEVQGFELIRGKLEEEGDKVRVLIDGVKVVALRALGKEKRTPEQEAELEGLMKILPVIVDRMMPIQREYAARLIEDKKTAMGEKEGERVPDLSEDVEDLKKICTKGGLNTSTSSRSSVTVIDDSIEEAWLLRRNEPKKTLKASHKLFGMKFLTWYTHEAASYYVKPLQTSASDIKEMRESASGKSTESKHQADLKKMVLSLDDKAQWEIQKLIEGRDNASSNDKVKREWEVVAFQTRPRRKICAPAEEKWWKKGKSPLVEWVMVLRGETIDHQKRVMPVKHEDPWKRKENEKSVGEVKEKTDTPTRVVEDTPMTTEEAQEKLDGVLGSLFKPAAVDGKGNDQE